MEFRNLKRQYEVLKKDMDSAMQEVLKDTNFISGRQITELESQLAEYTEMEYCITCANGTDALMLILMSWGIGRNDAVFVPDFTFFASGEVVSFLGAKPFFVDVDEATFNMDVEKLEKAIETVINEGKYNPRAIIAVDLFGQPANYPKIREVAQKYGLLILEDAAQGFGGRIGDKKAGSFGDAAATSFFPAKPVGCYGDGGAIFVNDRQQAEVLRSLCIHGKGSYKYDNIRIGVNSRLDTLQAAVLQVKLKAFRENELEKVNQIADIYTQELKEYVKVPLIKEGFYSSWAQYAIVLTDNEQRSGLQAYLKEKGIPSMLYYPKPMHMQKAFSPYCFNADYSVTERLCETILELPMHPYLESTELEYIIENVKGYIKKVS